MATWSEEELAKHVIMNVREIFRHPKYETIPRVIFDFGLLLLEAPVEMSKTVSPVCLPRPNEFTAVEKEKSILIGFGTSRLWYQLYDELLGGELPRAPLIPIEILRMKLHNLINWNSQNTRRI